MVEESNFDHNLDLELAYNYYKENAGSRGLESSFAFWTEFSLQILTIWSRLSR